MTAVTIFTNGKSGPQTLVKVVQVLLLFEAQLVSADDVQQHKWEQLAFTTCRDL